MDGAPIIIPHPYVLSSQGYQCGRAYRSELVKDLVKQVQSLPRENFAVKQHLRVIDQYQTEESFAALTYENTLQIAEHIAPLILPTGDDISAARFDMLIYQIELAILAEKSCKRAKNDVIKKAADVPNTQPYRPLPRGAS